MEARGAWRGAARLIARGILKYPLRFSIYGSVYRKARNVRNGRTQIRNERKHEHLAAHESRALFPHVLLSREHPSLRALGWSERGSRLDHATHHAITRPLWETYGPEGNIPD